nr:MAG TPA: Integrase [Caudoviricetes sp.]
MDNLSVRFVFDRKKEANSTNKQGLLQVEVRENGTSNKVFISTGIKLLSTQFLKKKGEIGRITRHDNEIELNGKAKRIIRDIEAFTLSDRCKCLQDVKNWDSEPEESVISVVTFIENELKRRNPSLTVIAQNKSLMKRLIEFGKIKTFQDFTYENIIGFDAHLKAQGMQEPTAYKRHSMLHGYIREAINRGYCKYDPYITFRPKKGKERDPIFLEEFELEALKNYDLSEETESESLTRVKDLFVFQCFTGLAYVDLAAFRKEDIAEIDGYKVIRSNRTKTEQGYITVLLPDAIEILEKYDYKLPIISNQKYNAYLKLVALYVKDEKTKKPVIKKKLTSHVARHTFGTYLVNKGVPYETVARTMGHSNTKMTKHYAKLLGKTVVNDVVTHVLNINKKDS